ncbi:sensor histidine kinase [Virgibacillus phasianinus]|uniref:histidine kinase n=1 Tax=Virgibacillus phasianinus TaxID=2017483 RepID=A0A220TZ16_9BACI|nr:HAMP domain-containing histidine kinase [Virgibacillus phasianinus]ASK61047.1 sensor histidine kinase [Virgibacillus phasianinus]
MKKFILDQLGNILFFYSQWVLMIIIVQIASRFSGTTLSAGILFYLFLLPTCFYLVFLVFKYFKQRDFYKLENVASPHVGLPEPSNHLLQILRDQHDKQDSEYQEKIEQLEQHKQLEIDFIQQWVHQMKTPVSVLHLTIQKEKMNLPESFADSLYEEIEHLQQGLDLALYQSRLQKFDRDFHVDRISLRSLVNESIQEFKTSFIRTHVFPEQFIDESIDVATDAKWFRFVLHQIITNAIKYSKGHSEKISFRSKTDSQTTTLQIEDYGHGIPKQDISRIFDPFFTGMNGRKFRESTGMGLYLSKEICKELGHEISVESEQNAGTTVSITFTQPKV